MEKITYKGFTLFDGAEKGPSGMALNYEAKVQIDEVLRGDSVVVQARGNGVFNFRFSLEREFDTVEDALDFYLLHAAELPTGDVEGGLICTLAVGTELQIPDAVLQSANMREPEGVSIITEYAFIGSKVIR